jgi:hypothetical protein
MQLRSGRSTLRRDSRNMDEFNERRKYQQEQRRIEDSIYEDEVNEDKHDKVIKKMKYVFRMTKHLLYLNNFQVTNKHSFTQIVKTVMELFELFRYNTDYLIEYFTIIRPHDKRFPEVIYNKGLQICDQMFKYKRTRQEHKLYLKCKEDIHWVLYLLEAYILRPQ